MFLRSYQKSPLFPEVSLPHITSQKIAEIKIRRLKDIDKWSTDTTNETYLKIIYPDPFNRVKLLVT